MLNPNDEAKSAFVPQPTFVSEKPGSLQSRANFSRVEFLDMDNRKLTCEYFPQYGEPGHDLVYLRGSNNLPSYVSDVLPLIIEFLASKNILPEKFQNSWRLTMNFYDSVNGRLAGFPFHVDIPANGVVTMILNVEREVIFEITDGERLEALSLPVGALLILSGDSRYKWKHRVKPIIEKGSVVERSGRVSLVLGLK